MSHRSYRALTMLVAIATLAAPPATLPCRADADDDAGLDLFEARIRPVLVRSCYECHSSRSDPVQGGLRLDTREGIRAGGDIGPAVVPGQPAESLILDALRYDLLEMPPSGRLPDEVIADFERWIALGAPDSRDTASAEDQSTAPEINLAAARSFWAFQPPRRHELPKVREPGRVRTPLDAFLLTRIDEAGLAPSPEADRRTLIRRVTFDLIGLPPSPEEIEAFVESRAPDAYERLVDRLLASPRFGERWARPWLDLARYAEDQAHIVGDDTSLCYPNAYLYRDWVIRALNADMPYDRFLIHQLADDLLDPDETTHRAALGFLGLGPKYYRRGALEVMADEWEDRVDVVTRGLLGLTVACARCHDHKFDPIPTTDYYALAGVFAGTEMYNQPLSENAELGKNGQAKKPEDAMHIVRDAQTIADLNVFIRGNVDQKGPIVERRFLSVLNTSSSDSPPPFGDSDSGRLALARAIADRDNPLTARVLVNRVWGILFGRPLVGTPSNFGQLGERPTHPELLDNLAAWFMESGWSIKSLIREIVLSAAYRRSSVESPALASADPENRLLARMNRKRLDVEAWRDAVLAAAGRLDDTLGGRSIEPERPEETRRTLYSRVSRLELNDMLALFDFPDPNAHSERRVRTTTPLQKLFLMNSPFLIRQAEALADRVARECGRDVSARIDRAYRLLFGREPSEEELAIGRAYLAENEDSKDSWIEYAQALIATNEMLFVD